MLLQLSVKWMEGVYFQSLGAKSLKQYWIFSHQNAIQGIFKVDGLAVAQSSCHIGMTCVRLCLMTDC